VAEFYRIKHADKFWDFIHNVCGTLQTGNWTCSMFKNFETSSTTFVEHSECPRWSIILPSTTSLLKGYLPINCLGLNLSSNLKWNEHVNMITKKAARRIYSVRLRKRAGVADTDLVTFYSTCVRTVLEYACPAWFYLRGIHLREQIESIQRRIMRIIFPDTKLPRCLKSCWYPSAMCEIGRPMWHVFLQHHEAKS
jgi:hypothetical protein